jgi:hypothetical protein
MAWQLHFSNGILDYFFFGEGERSSDAVARKIIPSACISFEAATRPRFLCAVSRTRIFPPPPPGWMTRGIVGGLGSEM